jgi:hypothetical protein
MNGPSSGQGMKYAGVISQKDITFEDRHTTIKDGYIEIEKD